MIEKTGFLASRTCSKVDLLLAAQALPRSPLYLSSTVAICYLALLSLAAWRLPCVFTTVEYSLSLCMGSYATDTFYRQLNLFAVSRVWNQELTFEFLSKSVLSVLWPLHFVLYTRPPLHNLYASI